MKISLDNISAARAQGIKSEIAKIGTTTEPDLIKSLQSTLTVISPKLNSILADMADELNVLPPSPAMAGAYCMVDNSINVAKSPANLSLGSVISPSVNINNENQEEVKFTSLMEKLLMQSEALLERVRLSGERELWKEIPRITDI